VLHCSVSVNEHDSLMNDTLIACSGKLTIRLWLNWLASIMMLVLVWWSCKNVRNCCHLMFGCAFW